MLFGLFPIVKALFILALSFFILFVVSKTESKGLKQFGRIIAIALCIIATYVIIMALYSSATGKSCLYKSRFYRDMPYKKMHHGMMK